MSVESIFSSETKIQILRTLSSTNSSYSAQELEKEVTKNSAAIYSALDSLKKEEILIDLQPEGKTRYYQLNEEKEVKNAVENLFEAEKQEYKVKNIPTHILNLIFNLKQKLVNQVDDLDRIILFGSTARGSYTSSSDIDLYIVIKEKTKEKEDQIYEITEEYNQEFSLIMRDREHYLEEFEKAVSSLAKSIVKDGYITLYGTSGTDPINRINAES